MSRKWEFVSSLMYATFSLWVPEYARRNDFLSDTFQELLQHTKRFQKNGLSAEFHTGQLGRCATSAMREAKNVLIVTDQNKNPDRIQSKVFQVAAEGQDSFYFKGEWVHNEKQFEIFRVGLSLGFSFLRSLQLNFLRFTVSFRRPRPGY